MSEPIQPMNVSAVDFWETSQSLGWPVSIEEAVEAAAFLERLGLIKIDRNQT